MLKRPAGPSGSQQCGYRSRPGAWLGARYAETEGDREHAITGIHRANQAFADAYVVEDDALHYARRRAQESGIRPVAPSTGAVLRLLAASVAAKAVAEIGTGTGVSGIHLLHGMRPDGVLTTVDREPDRQCLARQAFTAAGFPANRARLIPGRALEVLPRLADGGYDLVFCDGDRGEYVAYLAESLRLLRPGGLVCFEGIFTAGRTVDPARQGSDAQALRELVRAVWEVEELVPAVLPTNDGLLCAVKRS